MKEEKVVNDRFQNIKEFINPSYSLEIDSIDMREVMGEYTLETAKRDIDKRDLKLVILGGFGGVPKVDDVKRQHFEKKYQVNFKFRGCLRLRMVVNRRIFQVIMQLF